jgi:trigger factor
VKVQVEDISSVKKRILIQLPKEEVDKHILSTFKEYAQKTRIKGFRPGKVPFSVLERFYGKEILEDARDKLIERSFEEALKEKELVPLSPPSIERGELRKGEDYSFLVHMEIKPSFKLPKYKGIQIKKEKVHVTDEMVEKRLEELRRQYASLKDVEEDRPVEEQDHVVVLCTVVELGGEKKEEEPRTVVIDLSDQEVNSVWRQELIGKSVGAKGRVNFTFREDHPNKELRQKEAVIDYEIKGIKRLELPPLDDGFAKTVSSQLESLDQLRERLWDILKASEQKRIENAVIERLTDHLLSQVNFEIPDGLVEIEINGYIQNMLERTQASGVDFQTVFGSYESLREQVKPMAIRNVKEMLILADIAEKEGISVDQGEIVKELSRQAQASGQSVEAIFDYYKNRGMLGALRYQILKGKTLKYLLQHANIIEEEPETDTNANNSQQEAT